MAGGQLTPNDVAMELAGLARRLDSVVNQMQVAEQDATAKRAAFDLAFSKAFLSADGSMDLRKHQAVVATNGQRAEADVAEAAVRHLRRVVDAIKVRIDVGRSVGAAIRAEISLAGVEEQ
jgi:hypothetical protein